MRQRFAPRFVQTSLFAISLLSACSSDSPSDTDDGDVVGERDAATVKDSGVDASASNGDASDIDARANSTDASRSEDATVDDAATPTKDAGADAASDAGPQISAGPVGTPPATWKEHWFEHDQTLKLVDYNDWVALYFDDDVDRKQTTWVLPFMTRVWQYTVQHYGKFTDGKRDGRLYAIYHQGKYGGGHPSTYFDSSHDFRNVSDVGAGPYPDGSYAISTHEVSHIVELASDQMHGSPAFGIWGDSKWAEFYQYDLYVGLGITKEAERVLKEFSDKSDDFPSPGTHWFRDWFYPLWRDHGGVDVMVRYFQLLADHFRKNGSNFGNGMNLGEFVHFMSGAAGTDLKSQAMKAFTWNNEREQQLTKARTDFPGVKY